MRWPGPAVGTSRWAVPVALGLLAIAGAGGAQSVGPYAPPMHSDDQPHVEKSERAFGRFTVIRKVEDYRSVPILHGPWLVMEASLQWQDSTGQATVTITDNGVSVMLGLLGAKNRTTCLYADTPIRVGPATPTSAAWKQVRPLIARGFAACDVLTPADRTRLMAELDASLGDLPPAMEAWRTVSRELFGPATRRCIKIKADRRLFPPRNKCVRYSER